MHIVFETNRFSGEYPAHIGKKKFKFFHGKRYMEVWIGSRWFALNW